MEFVQFHPTALAVGDRAFLISEAVRGEGAHLVDERGRRFMLDVHADGELAPRDVVAREIQRRLAGGRGQLPDAGPPRRRAQCAPRSRTWSRAPHEPGST